MKINRSMSKRSQLMVLISQLKSNLRIIPVNLVDINKWIGGKIKHYENISGKNVSRRNQESTRILRNHMQ